MMTGDPPWIEKLRELSDYLRPPTREAIKGPDGLEKTADIVLSLVKEPKDDEEMKVTVLKNRDQT